MSPIIQTVVAVVLMGVFAYLQATKDRGANRVLKFKDNYRVVEISTSTVSTQTDDGEWHELTIDYKRFPLKRIGIARKVDDEQVYLYLLELDETRYHPILVKTHVDNVAAKPVQLPVEFKTAQEIQGFIDDNTNQLSDLESLEEQRTEILRIRGLVSSSEAYATNLSLIDRAVEQMSKQVFSCEKLIEINTAIIRDSLISFAVAGFDVRFDDDKHLQRVFQYRQLQEDYQQQVEVMQRTMQMARNGVEG
jgi:hypothetical protein